MATSKRNFIALQKQVRHFAGRPIGNSLMHNKTNGSRNYYRKGFNGTGYKIATGSRRQRKSAEYTNNLI
jgi:hypothetical protein